VGYTLVPEIFMSDTTDLSNFAGDKNEWTVNMTIGNISSKIHHMPSTHTVLTVALQPIPIKNNKFPQRRMDEQQKTNREVRNEVVCCMFFHTVWTLNSV